MKYFSPIVYLLILTLFTSCFAEEDKQPLKPFAGIVASVSHSIYTHQIYYSLTNDNEVSFNENDIWDLGFEANTNGENIIINSGINLFVTNLGQVDFTQTITIPDDAVWVYDASSGNPDSLAINNWVDTSTEPYTYSNNVYVIAHRNGLGKYIPIKKFSIIELTNKGYQFISDLLENSVPDTTIIEKDNLINYVKVDISDKVVVVDIEPSTNNWDILFTQYASIIPDDNGVPTPYVLRGTYINHKRISVAQYYISTNEVAELPNNSEIEKGLLQEYFESNAIPIPHDSLFSNNWDAIGYKWKNVTIDEEANTAVYKANTRLIYFVKENSSGSLYKLRFFSYYTEGVKGYPWFQYGEIE